MYIRESMKRPVFVAGVGMTKFSKPGAGDRDYPDLVREAGGAALADAGIGYEQIEQVAAGYVYGDSCSGQRAVMELGLTGVPVYNLSNACASGSTALMLARQLVEGGLAEVVLAVGFEKMQRGSLSVGSVDRASPIEPHLAASRHGRPEADVPIALELFGNAGLEHMQRYGSTTEHFAMVGEKNHRHSSKNPHAQFQDVYTLEEILASPAYHGPLTKLQCSPTSDGAAAAVLMSEDAVDRFGLGAQAVEIVAQAMASDKLDSFEPPSAIHAAGSEVSRAAARQVYDASGIGPEDVQVIELHDCFSVNEVLTYEALGLAREGEGHLLIERGATTYGGTWVVNPSGGLISKGHPLGATGLAQCAELSWQLRGEADERQVEGARYALQHNLGTGSAGVVTLYRAPAA
jgi:acetyl-CoA acyltransferase